ncbi:4Fe-4S dicluster domain-containing protein [Nevskia soli]|uniref:4Fe-4S dicluster domain-containing protein n=1 Tax=Nevskia soli TaxID=418856 RepID=UPI000A0218F0|nr:ferredoxin family protein [Nevskia soli]
MSRRERSARRGGRCEAAASAAVECKQEPGLFVPVIDRNRCEGKADCVEVCPYEVFVVTTLPVEQRTGLSFLGRLKGRAHGWQQALTPNAEACHACGLCVKACPESAITLARA